MNARMEKMRELIGLIGCGATVVDPLNNKRTNLNTNSEIMFDQLKKLDNTITYKELYGDMFTVTTFATDETRAFCVTTNGIIKNNGEAVMGAGVAKLFANMFPSLPKKLASMLTKNGNHVFNMGLTPIPKQKDAFIITFPTKNHWRDDSDLNLIRQSCKELMEICDTYKIDSCFLPAPGIGKGGLDYETQVKPILLQELDYRINVCFK